MPALPALALQAAQRCMAGASGLSGATCVLCPAPAAVFCRNDGVLLCADCDVHTHSSSDYLSRHERVPLLYLPPADRARVIGGDCVGMLSIPVTSESLRCGLRCCIKHST